MDAPSVVVYTPVLQNCGLAENHVFWINAFFLMLPVNSVIEAMLGRE